MENNKKMYEKRIPRMMTPKTTFTVDYPEAVEFADRQASVFWPHDEVKVHKDKQDILVNMTESERHGVITTLKLFTLYELIIGDDFWLNFVMKKFPRPADIQPMAAMFGAMELQVHSKFYAKINEELGLADDDFYTQYLHDPELKARVDFLRNSLEGDDDLVSLGMFTFAEGAILFSSFAYLMHFQSQGKNKLLNVVSGVRFSNRDEAIHSEAAGWLFRTLLQEKSDLDLVDDKYKEKLENLMYVTAEQVLEHEKVIIRKLFEKGRIEGITEVQLENFAKSRINVCLRNMGYKNLYKIDYNPVSEWFYSGTTGYQMNDFFNSQGNQYERSWDENGFTF